MTPRNTGSVAVLAVFLVCSQELSVTSGLAGPATDHAVALELFWYDMEGRADEENQRVWLQEIAVPAKTESAIRTFKNLRARLDERFG